MKKILFIFSIIFFISTNGSAITTIYGGPTTVDEAKKKFFKDRNLDIIEGIWYQEAEGALYAIVKVGDGFYHKWTIDHKKSKYIGTRDEHTGIRKSVSDKIYVYKTTVYNIRSGEETEGSGTYLMSNDNFIEYNIIAGCWPSGDCWSEFGSHMIRMWPENIRAFKNNNETETKPKNESGQLVSGSGFFIDKNGYVVTNSHVIDGCKNDKKVHINNVSKNFEIVADDKSLDLALLKTDIKNKDYIKITREEVNKLDKIIVAGYPLGKFLSDDLKFTEGIVSSLKGFMDSSHEMQIDAAINTGNSGGPVVNENGELVGVAVATLSKEITEGINFAIKSSSVEMFLKSNSIRPIKSSFSFGNLNRSKLRELLENSTVYISCKL